MQGRLTAPRGRAHVQFFPNGLHEWEEEFYSAKDLGINFIEWILPEVRKNPFSGNFNNMEYLKIVIKQTSTQVNSVCLDYLMGLDFNIGVVLSFARDSIDFISNMAVNIGCQTIIIPVNGSSMDDFIRIITIIEPIQRRRPYLKVAFEFLNVNSFTGINFLNDLTYGSRANFEHTFTNYGVGCCFDIGNNYQRNIIEEMENYNKYNMLFHIHIKEKDSDGNSVSLGNGVIGKRKWREIFTFLKDVNYTGDFTLQVARGEEGEEKRTVREQMEFIKELM